MTKFLKYKSFRPDNTFPFIMYITFIDTTSVSLIILCFFGVQLESNIQLRAISDEWLKHVDSVVTVGSSSHVVTSKPRMQSRNVTGRKRSTCLESEPHSSKNLSSGLGLFWWRGGRLTRQLFNWKVLPRSLACKAARHGLCLLF